jgi:hypothetical protein
MTTGQHIPIELIAILYQIIQRRGKKPQTTVKHSTMQR